MALFVGDHSVRATYHRHEKIVNLPTPIMLPHYRSPLAKEARPSNPLNCRVPYTHHKSYQKYVCLCVSVYVTANGAGLPARGTSGRAVAIVARFGRCSGAAFFVAGWRDSDSSAGGRCRLSSVTSHLPRSLGTRDRSVTPVHQT